MKVINSIVIKNMYAHKDTTIVFSEGKNYIVGPIGSGKTEILQAIGFAFFGTTALRDVAAVYKNIHVELDFNYKGESFIIKRKINDASFLMLDKETNEYLEIVNSTSGVNQKIISLFGYNYEIFLLSNFCEQKKLSHFSELSPAKRLQYIDKISGIEEANDLSKYLEGKRKILKSNLKVLKDVNIEPQISNEIDLDFDYLNHIDVLNFRLNNINILYNEYNYLARKISNKPVEPIQIINELEKILLESNEETIQSFINYFTNYKEIKNYLYILNDKILNIPKLPKKYKNITLEEVEEKIKQHHIKSIYEHSNSISVVCTSCKEEHNLKDLLNTPDCSLQTINIADLHNIHNYLLNGYEAIEEQLRVDEKNTEEELERISKDTPIVVSSLNTLERFNIELTKALNKNQEYQRAYSQYIQDEETFNLDTQDLLKLKEEIDSALSTQGKDIELKDLYIKYNTEKQIYLERLGLYLEAKEKINQFNIELDVIQESLKNIKSISLEIKNQTIPLINYHSSYFLNLITNGKMSSIDITENYDLIVDGFKIGVRSGGEQDLASLAFRLSLSQSIISGMLPLFLADEIDSAGSETDSSDIVNALDTISNAGFQIIMVTHKNTTNVENVNIIQL